MHSLHTLLPSHGQRYKRICQGTSVRRNVPALQAARWATRLGPRVFTVQTGFLQALHCCTGEGEKGRRGEASLRQGAVQVHSKFSAPSMRRRQQLSLRWQCRHAGGKTLPNQGALAPWQAGSKTVVHGGTAAASAAHHCGRLRPFAALCRLLPYCVFRGRMNAKSKRRQHKAYGKRNLQSTRWTWTWNYQPPDISVTCHEALAGGAPAPCAIWCMVVEENTRGAREGRLHRAVASAMAKVQARTQRERRLFMVCLLRFEGLAWQPGGP